ncbi:hypothetical protein [Actinacidiphila glaucinigra]|uniref:hypothetical protein n=1 Tax=Actinacidiphila glaucinigra TaxID=235986 RepID=UPI00366FE6B1
MTAHPAPVPAEFVRFAVALEPGELAVGCVTGRVTDEDARWLAFLRGCDLGELGGRFAALAEADPEVWRQAAAEAGPEAGRVWAYLEGLRRGEPDAAGRQEFLVGRAADGRGMNWADSSALMGTDRPEEVDAAFERGEPLVGVAVIGLALTHPDADAILPRVARALEAPHEELRHQGVVALAHVARLHATVDDRCLELLRGLPPGTEAHDDILTFVPLRRLPWWLRGPGYAGRLRAFVRHPRTVLHRRAKR